jgi:aminopeptidase N
MNESFADFSEFLWLEHKHDKDAAAEHNYNSMLNYLRGGNEKKDLVRFYYNDREDVFDLVSYQKGGRILNMLRNYVGDSAFFKSLNLYLRTRKFNTGEAQDLRLAFEDITGQDLNWFWNQWYYGSGHPKLDINYDYDADGKTAKVFIKQTQTGKIFKLPIAIDIYQGTEKKRYNLWSDHQADTFVFHTVSKPDLINVDGDKTLLCEKTEHKTLDNFIFQYKNAGLYLDRREAIEFAARSQTDDHKALDFMKTALKDPFPGLRIYTLQRLNFLDDSLKKSVEPLIAGMAANDPKSLVRASAIEALGRYKSQTYKPLFLKSFSDSSYSIAGKALVALAALDTAAALNNARSLSGMPVKGALSDAVTNILFTYSNEKDFDSLAIRFTQLPFGNEKFMVLQPFANFLKRVKDPSNFRKGVDMIVSFRDTIPQQYRQMLNAYFNGMILNGIATSKQSKGMTEQADYVKSKLPVKEKAPATPEIQKDTLQKYAGEYEFNGVPVHVTIKNEKTLFLNIPEQPEMELVPVSKGKFTVKYMEGYSMEFIVNTKGEVTELVFKSPGGETKAPRKK